MPHLYYDNDNNGILNMALYSNCIALAIEQFVGPCYCSLQTVHLNQSTCLCELNAAPTTLPTHQADLTVVA